MYKSPITSSLLTVQSIFMSESVHSATVWRPFRKGLLPHPRQNSNSNYNENNTLWHTKMHSHYHRNNEDVLSGSEETQWTFNCASACGRRLGPFSSCSCPPQSLFECRHQVLQMRLPQCLSCRHMPFSLSPTAVIVVFLSVRLCFSYLPQSLSVAADEG